MTEGRRQVLALCAAVREALTEVERLGMLSDDAPDACLGVAERWARREADERELREALATMRERVEAQQRPSDDAPAPAMITAINAVDCVLRAARDVAWDDRASIPRDAVFFWVESTLELAGERGADALARASLAWDAALRRAP